MKGVPEVFLQSLDERCFTLFEADIVASGVSRGGRFPTAGDSGDSRCVTALVFPRASGLSRLAVQDIGNVSAMTGLMQHLRDVLGGAEPLCSGEDAIAAQQIAERFGHERAER